MEGVLLKNDDGEYIKTIDTANGKLEFTHNPSEAKNYNGMMGGAEWSSNNEKEFIIFHFKDEYQDKVTTLQSTYERWDE